VVGVVIGSSLDELPSRRLGEVHTGMDFLGVTHSQLDQLLVILCMEMGAIWCYALDSPHRLAAPFCDD
jgi:hypothetical protein